MIRSTRWIAGLCAVDFLLLGAGSSDSSSVAPEAEGGKAVSTPVREPETGVSFPSHVRLGSESRDYQLTLTGAAVRSGEVPHLPLLKVKVYVVAHYLDSSYDGTVRDIFSAATKDGLAKQIRLKFLRGVDAQRLQEACRRGLSQTVPRDEEKRLEPLIQKFLQVFASDMRAGDEVILSWLPGGRLLTSRYGVPVMEVQDQTLAQAVWGVWLGEHAVVDRNRLVSLWQRAVP